MVSEVMKKKIKWQAFGKYSKGMEVLSMKTENQFRYIEYIFSVFL